jgi:hypothetical protein
MPLLPHTYTTPIVDLSNADWIMRMKTNEHNTYRKRKIITAFKRIETVQLFPVHFSTQLGFFLSAYLCNRVNVSYIVIVLVLPVVFLFSFPITTV